MSCSECHRVLGYHPDQGDYVRICVCGLCNQCHVDYMGQPNDVIPYTHWLCEEGMPVPVNQNDSLLEFGEEPDF